MAMVSIKELSLLNDIKNRLPDIMKSNGVKDYCKRLEIDIRLEEQRRKRAIKNMDMWAEVQSINNIVYWSLALNMIRHNPIRSSWC
jgi:hypothetical protein